MRRGACPGLSAPMPTGDGLLVRLLPIGTLSLAAFAGLCAAARNHGNGIVEITSRGSFQVRGLSALSAPQFAEAIAALGIAADDGIAVLCDPLAGLDDGGAFDVASFAAYLRRGLTRRAMAASLSPKVSIVVDGGSPIGLDAVAADIRVRARPAKNGVVLCIAVGGDAAGAAPLGVVSSEHGVETCLRLLTVIAQHGTEARARDVAVAEFRSATDDLLLHDAPPPDPCRVREALGCHRLGDGSLACGIGFAFGHADAASLERLIDAARDAGATGLRTAPSRTLLAIGLTDVIAPAFLAAAERLGFITRPHDPRRHVVACAGAPICASAHLASRALAPSIAATVASSLDAAHTIHLSGCAKGCARAAPAALTVTGTPDGCALIAGGTARDTPFAVVSLSELPTAIEEFVRQCVNEAAHA